MKIVIIEDEKPAYEQLVKLIAEVDSSIEIIRHLDSIESALAWFGKNGEPDLILSDIHLADGPSFLIYEKIKIDCPIIFTTAYDEYALKAFKLNSIDYLLKPINKPDLKHALEKYKNLRKDAIVSDMQKMISSLLNHQKSYKDRFLVKMADRLLSIHTPEISYFVSEDKFVSLYHQGQKYLIDFTIEDLEDLLDPNTFFKLNRKIIANISSISKIFNHFNGKLKVDLNPSYPEEIFVSREKAGSFKSWLDGEIQT